MRKENCGKRCVGTCTFCKQHNYQLSDAIQNLPPELREKIYKEYVAIKIEKERKWAGMRYIMLLKRRPSVKND